MPTFIMLTSVTHEATAVPGALAELGNRVSERLKAECPEARWLASYAVLGPYDYVDIFEAPDSETAARAALIVRSAGHAQTQVWSAIPWERFREMIATMERPREAFETGLAPETIAEGATEEVLPSSEASQESSSA
ncbi:MAG TPA: GYD domain-containing protein [Thermomicrobiales bacterium]